MKIKYSSYILLYAFFSFIFIFYFSFCFENDFEKRIIFQIKINSLFGLKNKTYKLSDYISDYFDGVIFYPGYDDEFYKFVLYSDSDREGVRLKLTDNGELSENQLLLRMENYQNKNIYAFKCNKLNSYIRYIGYNDTLKSYEFYPIGCEIIYK